ncbi:MAG: sensor histidine kinase [Oceanospirillales bacterium]|nr:MAG: sensor histidine kinase [Oceanospirillales bacterium]
MNSNQPEKNSILKRMSLVQRIVLVVVFGWLSLIIITIISVHLSIKNTVIEDFYNSEENHLLMIIERVESAFEQRQIIMQQLAQLMLANKYSLIDEEEITEILKIAQISNLFEEFVILDTKGISTAQYPFNPDRVNIDYSDRDFVKYVIDTKKGVISQPVLGRVTGLPSIFILEPIFDIDSNLLGIMIGRVDLEKDSLFHQVSNEFIRFEGELLILDLKHDIFVASTNSKYIMQPVNVHGLINNIVNAYVLDDLGKDISKDWVYSVAHFNKFDWIIINITPVNKITALVNDYVNDYLKIILPLIVILGFIVSIWVYKTFTPLRDALYNLEYNILNQSAFSSIHVSSADEVGKLLMAINQLQLIRDKHEKMKEELLSNVTHELRTPLTAIRAAVNLLAVDNNAISQADQKKLIVLSQRNADKLLLLINDLLDLSSLSQGKLILEMKEYNLFDVVSEAVRDIDSLAKNAGIRISFSPDKEKVFVLIDKFRFQQVLFNLLSNAIKFSPKNSVITVKITKESQNVSVLVSDQGIGVAEKYHKMIFERFTQVDSSDKKIKSGTGLGLAISSELMKDMNGNIWLKSNPPKGSTFGIDLPIITNI